MKKRSTAGKMSAPSQKTVAPKIYRDRYRVFIEEVADGFYECNLRGDFKYFNNALCRIFGYPREEIQDRNYREFMDEDNARIAFDSFNKIYQTGREITEIIWQIIRKDGETRIVEISANVITDDSGEKIGFRGIARDITKNIWPNKKPWSPKNRLSANTKPVAGHNNATKPSSNSCLIRYLSSTLTAR